MGTSPFGLRLRFPVSCMQTIIAYTVCFVRQYSSALDDLATALSYAPNNRELLRLKARIEDEMKETPSLRRQHEAAASVTSSSTATTPMTQTATQSSSAAFSTTDDDGQSNRHSGIPDIVSETVVGIGLELERFKEETAL
jgi:hypothetical protein